jgi:hypothetical protein
LGFVLIGLFSKSIGDYGFIIRAEHGYEHPIARLLVGFIDMGISDGYQDETVKQLLSSHIIIPDDSIRLIIGNNNFGQYETDSIDSDIGYLRMIYGFGLVGLVAFIFGVFIKPIQQARRALNKYSKLNTNLTNSAEGLRLLFQACIVIIGYGCIAHWKLFFLSTRIFEFIFFLLLFLLLNKIGVENQKQFFNKS